MGIRTTFSGSAMIQRHEERENDDEIEVAIEYVGTESNEFDPCFGDEEYSS